MNDLSKRRLAIAEARFDDYQFGWDVEETHHWHTEGDVYCRSVLFCGDSPGTPCVRGHFVVRFLPGKPIVDECYAMIDGCLVGREPDYAQEMRKAG